MQNFILLIREDLARAQNQTEEDMQAEIQLYMQWVEEMAKSDNYISGDPLEPEGQLLRQHNVTSDGPFVESKEVITGYLLIQAKDSDEARKLGEGCPVFRHGGALEIRPVMKH